jgi:hypothetical protein
MNHRWSAATTAALGLLAVVLLMVANSMLNSQGGSPALHASAADYATSVASSATALVAGFLTAVAFLALAGFFLGVADTLRRAGTGRLSASLIAAGGVLTAAVGLAGAPPLLAGGILAADGDLTPPLAKALVLMNAATFVTTWLTVAVPIGVTAAAGMRTGILPRLLGYPGVAIAAALPVAALIAFRIEALTLAWLLAIVWLAGTSIVLTWRAARSGPVHAPLAPGAYPSTVTQQP